MTRPSEQKVLEAKVIFSVIQGYESMSIDPMDYVNKAVLVLGKGKHFQLQKKVELLTW